MLFSGNYKSLNKGCSIEACCQCGLAFLQSKLLDQSEMKYHLKVRNTSDNINNFITVKLINYYHQMLKLLILL